MVDEVTSISKQTAAEAQSVSAAAKEQTASLSEVSESADSLATSAADLSSLLDAFELSTHSGVTPEVGRPRCSESSHSRGGKRKRTDSR